MSKKAAEIREARKRMKMKQADLAKIIGVHWVTLSRWETEAVDVPEPMVRFVRLLARFHASEKRRGRS